MNKLKLFARREPTTDSASKDACKAAGCKVPKRWKDVVLYIHPDGQPVARFPHWSTGKPRFGQRTTIYNSYRWQLYWMPPLTQPLQIGA